MDTSLIQRSAANLPDTIEDLTQFVLVGKAKLQAYMLKLQTVNKLSVAQEIRDQTLKEAQEISTALIAAEQRIGELLLAIPKATAYNNPSGKSNTQNRGESKLGTQTEEIKNRATSNFENTKPKSEVIRDMGYSKDEASDYQKMAKNPEIVRMVIEAAMANGEVVTKSQVLKQIKTVQAKNLSVIDELESKVSLYEEEITRLRSRNSPLSREADTAYDFWVKVNSFTKNVLAPLCYDELISNNQNNAAGEYILQSCHLLIDAATDIIRRFKVEDIIDV